MRNNANMNVSEMEKTSKTVSSYMHLLSSPARLLLLCQLIEGEKSVGELCKLIGMKPPAVSQHLAKLRQEKILITRREGQTIFYTIQDADMKRIMGFLYETFCKPNSKGDA